MKVSMLTVAGLAIFLGCGRAPNSAGGSQIKDVQAASESLKTVKYNGTSEQGGSCSLELSLDSQNEIKSLKLSGTYTVDYKIPAPLSGLYGKYFYPGEFDTSTSINAGELKIGRGWLGGELTAEGDGKPLFWDTPATHHKVSLKGEPEDLKSASYHTVQKVAGLLPFVSTDLECKDLTKAE